MELILVAGLRRHGGLKRAVVPMALVVIAAGARGCVGATNARDTTQAQACTEQATQEQSAPTPYDWSHSSPSECGEVEQNPASTVDAGGNSEGTVRDATRVVAGLRKSFTACYYSTLARYPCEEGSVELRLEVDCGGVVSSIGAGARGLSPETVRCVIDAAGQARFSPPREGSAIVIVPVKFERGRQ